MTRYLVFLATGVIEIEADMVRTQNNYFTPSEGQQPTICFYRGLNATKDNLVAEFVYKNISGYCRPEVMKRQLP